MLNGKVAHTLANVNAKQCNIGNDNNEILSNRASYMYTREYRVNVYIDVKDQEIVYIYVIVIVN